MSSSIYAVLQPQKRAVNWFAEMPRPADEEGTKANRKRHRDLRAEASKATMTLTENVVGSSPTGGAREPPKNRGFCYSLKSLSVQISLNFSSKVYFQAYNLLTEKTYKFSSAKKQRQDYIGKTSSDIKYRLGVFFISKIRRRV